ncbi:MAG: glycosyltransferase [Raineya sp.]|nr:glycosyltransferase [Raineya sp.]MDW8296469.1 glycosyltransferase [Raineya sp.]
MKKILFIFPYPSGTAGSQRFRFEQYLDFLREKGFQISLKPFLDEPTWQILYKKGHFWQKIIGILKGFSRRLLLLFQVPRFDFVFVHREATPLGLPFVEWMICKVFRKKMIFDFDDAIWLPNTSAENKIVAWLKFHQKTGLLCKWAYKVSAGNRFLAEYAQKFNPNVFINPTTIDTENWHNPQKFQVQKRNLPVIGWTGTHSTIQYLEPLVAVLEKVASQKSFIFILISDKPPTFKIPNLEYVAWRKETEIQDLMLLDIGIMPLIDDDWAKGKCGFKALQYMALEIVPVVSPVGVNTEIVQDGYNGFICENEKEWEQTLLSLLENTELRKELGKKARQSVIERYSVTANRRNFEHFFEMH